MQNFNPDITLFGSVWSPPQWMKAGGGNSLLPQFHAAWVTYMMLYLEAYASLGVRIAAITLQVR
jgi:glucosylceramidase